MSHRKTDATGSVSYADPSLDLLAQFFSLTWSGPGDQVLGRENQDGVSLF